MDMKTKTNKHKVDRDTTYCRWSGVHLSRRLHGNSVLSHCSTQEPAHALSHTLLPSSLCPLTALPFPFSFSRFSLFHARHTHWRGLSGDDNKGWDCKLKVPPTVSAVYKHELTLCPPTAVLWLAGKPKPASKMYCIMGQQFALDWGVWVLDRKS